MARQRRRASLLYNYVTAAAASRVAMPINRSTIARQDRQSVLTRVTTLRDADDPSSPSATSGTWTWPACHGEDPCPHTAEEQLLQHGSWRDGLGRPSRASRLVVLLETTVRVHRLGRHSREKNASPRLRIGRKPSRSSHHAACLPRLNLVSRPWLANAALRWRPTCNAARATADLHHGSQGTPLELGLVQMQPEAIEQDAWSSRSRLWTQHEEAGRDGKPGIPSCAVQLACNQLHGMTPGGAGARSERLSPPKRKRQPATLSCSNSCITATQRKLKLEAWKLNGRTRQLLRHHLRPNHTLPLHTPTAHSVASTTAQSPLPRVAQARLRRPSHHYTFSNSAGHHADLDNHNLCSLWRLWRQELCPPAYCLPLDCHSSLRLSRLLSRSATTSHSLCLHIITIDSARLQQDQAQPHAACDHCLRHLSTC